MSTISATFRAYLSSEDFLADMERLIQIPRSDFEGALGDLERGQPSVAEMTTILAKWVKDSNQTRALVRSLINFTKIFDDDEPTRMRQIAEVIELATSLAPENPRLAAILEEFANRLPLLAAKRRPVQSLQRAADFLEEIGNRLTKLGVDAELRPVFNQDHGLEGLVPVVNLRLAKDDGLGNEVIIEYRMTEATLDLLSSEIQALKKRLAQLKSAGTLKLLDFAEDAIGVGS